MGLIKAARASLKGTFADQWKEFFYCESMKHHVLVQKGMKKTNRRSSNTKGNDNIITNGSGIVVNNGQAMIIVDQGQIVEFTAESGEYTFDSSLESSIFNGDLDDSIVHTFETFVKRFQYGGDTAHDQRVYYFNLKEIMDNKFGTVNPVPFRIIDKNIGLDMDISIRCHGVYSFQIVDPLLFYKNVCGNVDRVYLKEDIEMMLKSELLTALQPAFATLSMQGVRYSSLPAHTQEIVNELNNILNEKWIKHRGIKMTSLSILSVNASKEDEDMLKNLQKTAVFTNPAMAGATLVEAQASALKDAAKNNNGAMMGMMGMNMVQGASSMHAQDFYQMSKQQPLQKEQWTCQCGCLNTGKFCMECGQPKENGWICECGTLNKGKFCIECGKKKPETLRKYVYNKCGWEVEDTQHPPKSCPQCGDIINEDDKV